MTEFQSLALMALATIIRLLLRGQGNYRDDGKDAIQLAEKAEEAARSLTDEGDAE